MRLLFCLQVLVALALLSSGPAGAESELLIATESNYPPFARLDENGHLAGFDVDITKALCEAMNRRCKLIDVPWNELISGLEQGRFDAIVASLAKTAERAQRMDYTDRYYRSTSAFVGTPELLHSNSLDAMRGKTIAVVFDTVQSRYVDENYQGISAISYAPTIQEAFGLLISGEVDAVFAGRFPALSLLQSPEGREFDFVGDPITDAEYISDAYITVRKGDDKLRRSFNEAIRTIRKNGVYHRINSRYFPFDIFLTRSSCMQKTKTILLAGAMMALLSFSAWAEPLRVATEGAYPPFSEITESGQLVGFDVDIARGLCVAMNRPCELVAVPWDNIIDGLVQGKYDLIVASMAKTPEREKLMDFSDYYYRSSSAFIGREGTGSGTSAKDLAGRVLCVQEGTVQAEYVQSNYPDSTILLVPNQTDVFALLADGSADLALMDNFTALEFFQTPEGAEFDFVGEPLPSDHSSGTAYMQVRKGDDKLREAVNKALRQLRLNGEYKRINSRYFPFSIY